jgi:hypothetical protein
MKWIFVVCAVTVSVIFVRQAEAAEAVICMSMDDEYVLLAEDGAKCLEWETELRVSGSGVLPEKDGEALAKFGENADCPEGTGGRKAEVGIDSDGDGVLDAGEVLTATGTCSSAGGE